MGFGLEMYCESEVFHKKALVDELIPIFPPDGIFPSIGLKGAYNFFIHYEMGKEMSLFYLVCQKMGNQLYRYFEKLHYWGAEWPEETDAETAKMLVDLPPFKAELEHLYKCIVNIDRQALVQELISEQLSIHGAEHLDLGFKQLDYHYLIQKSGLVETLGIALRIIQLFEKHGAKKVVFVYT